MSEKNYPPTGPVAPTTGVTVIENVRLYGEGDPVSVRIVDGVIAEIGADVTAGDDAEAASYVYADVDGTKVWGIGVAGSITFASLKAVTSAVNRGQASAIAVRGGGV